MVIVKYAAFMFVLFFVLETVLGAFSNIRNVFAFSPDSKLLKLFKVHL